MEGINPEWYAQMLWYQKKYNAILASATVALSVTSILQLMKLYEYEAPVWLFILLVGIIAGAIELIIIESFSKPKF